MAWVVKKAALPTPLPGIPQPFVASETDVDTNSKSLAVGTVFGKNKVIEVQGIRVELTPDGTVGSRELNIQVLDGSVVVFSMRADSGVDISNGENEATEYGDWRPGFQTGRDPAVAGDGPHQHQLTRLWLHEDLTLKVFESGAGLGTNDDVIVHVRGRIHE